MTAAKHTLHLSHLEPFKDWISNRGGAWRLGKGEYQVIQVLTDRGWAPVYSKDHMPEHYSVDPRLLPLVRDFLDERRNPPVVATVTGRIPPSPRMLPTNMQTREPPWESPVDMDLSQAELRVISHMQGLRPCRSPYCECPEGQCSHPGCYDARSETQPGVNMPPTIPDFTSIEVIDPADLPPKLVAAFEQDLGPWAQATGEQRAIFVMGWYRKAEAEGVAP